METNIETRVSKVELFQNKLALVTQNLGKGQTDLASLIKEMSGLITDSAVEAVATAGAALFADVDQKLGEYKSANDKSNEDMIGKIKVIDETMKKKGITASQQSVITQERDRRVIHLLGGIRSEEYLVFNSGYFSEIGKDILYKFSDTDKPLRAYTHLVDSQFEDVIDFVHGWIPKDDRIKYKVIADMLILRDKTDKLISDVDSGNLSRSQEGVKSIAISKNEKKLDAFTNYMNKNIIKESV